MPSDLFSDLEQALAEDHPLPLLQFASVMLDSLDPRNQDPFKKRSAPDELPPLPDLLASLLAAGPAPAALAWAVAQLAEDDLLRARVTRTLGPPPPQWPDWLQRIDEVEPVEAALTTDMLRDSFNVVVHVRVAGFDLTLVILVDFNLGTVAKDGFLLDATLDEFRAMWAELGDAEQTAFEPLSLADARARIDEAIQVGVMTWPPLESESWPAARPLAQWLTRHLPAGGTDFVRPEWSSEDLTALTERFLASPEGRAVDRGAAAAILSPLLDYRTDYGYGDPLRWSSAAVEVLLLDWYPRKVMADLPTLQRVPAVLRGFIPFAHTEAGLDAELTAQTLAALDEAEPQYQASLTASSGPASRSAALNWFDQFITEDDLAAIYAELLADQVGGPEVLAVLDDDPLPDESFEWSGVADDLPEPVGEVLRLADACCDELLDVEHRTAVRRLLHDVAVERPRVFRSRGSATTAAAALVWLVGRANETIGAPGGLTTATVMAHFGLTNTPTSRANTMRQAVGAGTGHAPGSLGSARYLVSDQRRRLVLIRDAAE